MSSFRPGATGGILGSCPPTDCWCPPNENCAPPTEDSAQKKLTGSGLLQRKSRPKTPKLVFNALEIASKNCFFVIFVDSTGFHKTFGTKTFIFSFFFWSSLKNSWKIVRILRRQPEFAEIFVLKTFFFGLHLFRLIHTRINFSCPPKIYFCPPSLAILAPGLSSLL